MHPTVPLLVGRKIYRMDVLNVSTNETESHNGCMECRVTLILANYFSPVQVIKSEYIWTQFDLSLIRGAGFESLWGSE